MTILGIDPGTTRIGFGIIKADQNHLTCLDYGVIKTDATNAGAYTNTVARVSEIIDNYRPNAAAIEKLFFFTIRFFIPLASVIVLTFIKFFIGSQDCANPPLDISLEGWCWIFS